MADSTELQALSELPASAAADEIAFFEKAALFSGKGDITLGDTLARHRLASSFTPFWITTSVKNYHFSDVVLDGDSLLLLKDSSIIADTVYFVSDDVRRNLRVRNEDLIRCDATEDIIIGYNNVHWIDQQWMSQSLPTIDWSLRQKRRDHTRLVLPALQPWQEETLVLLGYRDIPRLVPEKGRQYLLPHAQYSQYLHGLTSFRISLSARATFQRLLAAVPQRASPHSIIYVPLYMPFNGPVVNEPELIDYLRSRGVHIVERDKTTVSERINLFRQADVVIGANGQGLTDVVFCKPGALLWELSPQHHPYACFNLFAQAAGVDYWGDLCDSVDQGGTLGWRVDLDMVANRLVGLRRGLAPSARRTDPGRAAVSALPADEPDPDLQRRKALDEIMLEFESLGDNCEFGLVQRAAGVEPLGLLRFAGFDLFVDVRLENLVAALEKGFEGLGALDTIIVELPDNGGHREFMVKETAYDLSYHTDVFEGQMGEDELRQREVRRLTFLRRKLLEDLTVGEKIWVWKSQATTDIEHIAPLMKVLRRYGPNILLFAVQADADHPAGTVERIEHDLIKGYVERFAPYERAPDIRPYSWFEICQRTYKLCRQQPFDEPALEEAPAPAASPLTGIDYLLSSPASLPPPTQPAPESTGLFSWLRSKLRRRQERM